MRTCILSSTPVCERAQLLYALAVHGSVTDTVDRLARRIRALAPQKNIWSFIQQALDEVQHLPYVPDPEGQDCYKTADDTAAYGAECKGKNILFSALMIRLGITAEPVWIMQEGMPLNHVASVVMVQGNPYWADASIPGARVGESPYEALERVGAYHIIGGKPSSKVV